MEPKPWAGHIREVVMGEYRVDRTHLETFSTEEIQRILREEYDDYTPEAIEILHDILEEREVNEARGSVEPAKARKPGSFAASGHKDMFVNNPHDAVQVLNTLLNQVLDRTIDPQVAQAAAGIVMGILRAKEQEFMSESEEES
jgi:hypothetical protein